MNSMEKNEKNKSNGKMTNRFVADIYRHPRVWNTVRSIGSGLEEMNKIMGKKKQG